MDVMIHTRSFRKGIQAMPDKLNFFKPEYWNVFTSRYRSSHIHLWTPSWHKGRGPYVNISISRIVIVRAY